MMRHEKKTPSRFTKPLLGGIVGLLAWTLSIHLVPVKLDAQPTTAQCQTHETTQQLFQSMTDGIITHMYNDGTRLSIKVSPAWQSLSNGSKKHLYHALQCLAEDQNVAFQISPSQVRLP